MAKFTLQNMANVLIEKNNLPKNEAEAFVAAVFDVIKECIERDRIVKVKGLGTFKVVSVDARESVNVYTGERFVIDSHDKISFTPDSMMKELVNKPFSSFETVVLNEGVVFDDIPMLEEPVVVEEPTVIEEPALVEEPAVVEEPTVIEEPALVEEPVVIEEPALVEEPVVVEESVKAEETGAVEKTALKVESAERQEEEKNQSTDSVAEENVVKDIKDPSKWWQFCIVAISCLAIGFALGFYTNKFLPQFGMAHSEETEQPLATDSATTEVATLPAQEVAAGDTLMKVVSDTASVLTTAEEDSIAAEPKQDAEKESYMKYESMDIRVKTGAYYIVGTESIVQAREGDNIAKVSRRYLGEGLSCYVEVYNGMEASTQLKVGQEVKIPKLILKKLMKQREKNQKNNQ